MSGSASPYYDHQIRRPFGAVTAGQTDAVILPAETGRKFRVLSAYGVATAATALTFNRKPSGSSVAISPAYLGADGHPTVDLDFNPHGWFETNSGESLTVTTGAGQTHQISLIVAALEEVADVLMSLLDGTMLWLEDNTPLLLESA